jgi:hypothetical protein
VSTCSKPHSLAYIDSWSQLNKAGGAVVASPEEFGRGSGFAARSVPNSTQR